MNPMETTFQTRKQFVRNAISEISFSAISFEDFQRQLFEKYKIHVKENRGRYSYLHPEREKYISGRSLASHYRCTMHGKRQRTPKHKSNP